MEPEPAKKDLQMLAPINTAGRPSASGAVSSPTLRQRGTVTAHNVSPGGAATSGASLQHENSLADGHSPQRKGTPKLAKHSLGSESEGGSSISKINTAFLGNDENNPKAHYFTKHGFSSASLASLVADDDPESGTGKSDSEPAPKRVFVRTQLFVTSLTCLLLLAVAFSSFYNLTILILQRNAYYAAFIYTLVPMGVFFFSFAALIGVKGLFSVVLGKSCMSPTAGGAMMYC